MNINYRLGIILPSYNDERVVNAIESIIKIDKNRLSKIYVIDGNSGEKITNKISNQLRQHDIHISEPDHGPFDALNKGLDIVEEEIIGWLGADDRYPTDIDKNLFESLVLNFDENPRVDALVYNCVHLDGEKISRVTYAVGSNDFAINWAITDGTTTTADYSAASGTLTISERIGGGYDNEGTVNTGTFWYDRDIVVSFYDDDVV